jgi:hypothetical protein
MKIAVKDLKPDMQLFVGKDICYKVQRVFPAEVAPGAFAIYCEGLYYRFILRGFEEVEVSKIHPFTSSERMYFSIISKFGLHNRCFRSIMSP